MGTSYEGLLIVGELEAVVEALTLGRVEAMAVEAAPTRIAVIPRDGPYDATGHLGRRDLPYIRSHAEAPPISHRCMYIHTLT